ncbi:MAG: GAF domain-containing protein, partial [Planctomycetota bacterium]|nr:GAF domain-containing protein [Planctomycetota bacterium]
MRFISKKSGWQFLCRMGELVASTAQYEQVLQRLVETTLELLRADLCSIRLLEPETGLLHLAACSGFGNSYTDKAESIPIGEGCIGRAVRDIRPVPVSDISKSPFKFPELVREYRLRSLLAVPIVSRGRVLGGMCVYSTRTHNYRDAEINVLSAIASQAAVAISNATLYQDSIGALFSLAKAIEAKDSYTRGHSERVTRYAKLLAEYAKLPERVSDILGLVCPLHDVGKIGVSEKILTKNGKLTPLERSIVARHPLIGADIIKPIRLFSEGIAIVRNHHEWIDGSGYPDGLVGDNIPLIARITSIADAFDAMTSHRTYRRAFSVRDAIAEVRRMVRKQFDKELAHMFVAVS